MCRLTFHAFLWQKNNSYILVAVLVLYTCIPYSAFQTVFPYTFHASVLCFLSFISFLQLTARFEEAVSEKESALHEVSLLEEDRTKVISQLAAAEQRHKDALKVSLVSVSNLGD